jgi:serine/threonine protein kinase
VSGEDTRSLAKKGNLAVIQQVAKVVADLHQKGVFFRSIHLENLLYQSDDKFALIDLAGVRFKSSALSTLLRYRNLRHLLGEVDDRELWQAFGVDNFLKLYFKHAQLSEAAEKVITFLIKRNVKLDEVAA